MPENSHPHSPTRWAQSKSDEDLISEYEFAKASSKLAEDGDHPAAKNSNDFRDLKNEERLEALAEEMELRKLGDYAYISGEGSTQMPPLAATPIADSSYMRPEGGSILRPDGTSYLRPQENSPSHSGQISSATGSEINFDPPPGETGQLPLSELPFKEVLDEDLGPMPDSIRELERYIAEIEMIFNGRDEQLSGPWPEEDRKELLERHGEAKSRLEEINGVADVEESFEEHSNNGSTLMPSLQDISTSFQSGDESPFMDTRGDAITNTSPNRTVMDYRAWEQYLQSRYNCMFDPMAVKLFQNAAQISVYDNRLNQLATQHLLGALTQPTFPLAGLQTEPSFGSYAGDVPPWHEDLNNSELDDAYASAKGFKPLSLNLDQCLQEAAGLARTTGEFRSINTWHIAFSLIKLNPPGFSNRLLTGHATLERVIKILRENARKNDPGIYRVLPWRLIEEAGISLSPMAKLAEEDGKKIRRLLDEMGIHPSFAVAQALYHAVAQCAQVANVNGSSQIRIEHLIVGLLTVSIEDESENYAAMSLPLAILRSLALSDDRIWVLWGRVRQTAATASEMSGWSLSADLLAALTQAQDLAERCTKGDSWLAARHLTASILLMAVAQPAIRESLKIVGLDTEIMASVLRDHLRSYEAVDDAMEWRKVLRAVPNMRWRDSIRVTGSQLMLQREASPNQLCLGIDGLSSAIKEMFENAAPDNDFVFGLFAPWGRGKSTLIKQVAAKLENSHKCVEFGAAKYPSRPEVWVHLYQTMADAAMSSGFWSKWRIRFRVGLLRTGWKPFFVGVFVASFSMLERLGITALAADWVLNGLGFIGLLILAAYAYRFLGLGKLIHRLYGHVPDHSDKLGLQAVIGDDLERLLRAWYPSRTHPDPWVSAKKDNEEEIKWRTQMSRFWDRLIGHFGHEDSSVDFRFFRAGWLAVALCLIMVGLSCFHGASSAWGWIAIHNIPKGAISAWNWGSAALFLTLFGFSVLAAFKIGKSDADEKRVLLIVDDLDRCEPEQSLSVIESIRWFLDNPKVNSRLQAAMLMERSALEAACKKRARTIGFRTKDKRDWAGRFQSHREKLFVVELALPDLDLGEVDELVSNVIDSEKRQNQESNSEKKSEQQTRANAEVKKATRKVANKKVAASPENMVALSVVGLPNSTKAAGSSAGNQTPASAVDQHNQNAIPLPASEDAVPLVNVPGHFADPERDALKTAFRLVSPQHLTPRSVRAAIVRYQFARRLLVGVDFEPADLMERLLDRMFQCGVLTDANAKNASQLDRVVSQLT